MDKGNDVRARILPILGIALLAFGLLLLGLALAAPTGLLHSARVPTPIPESLVPTALPSGTNSAWTLIYTLTQQADPFVFPSEARFRLGVSLPAGATQRYDLHALGVGWVMDWSTRLSPDLPPDIAYVQTVRMGKGVLTPSAPALTIVAAANPGSLWLISNEADVLWQDNVPPDVYARLYHEAYVAIKKGDPSALVAAGGIAQPTPLRLRYLDYVLAIYEAEFGSPLPAQAWHIHNYMLREEHGAWGVGIPPGVADDLATLYEIEDSGNLEAFRDQIYAFRRWMAAHAYRETPLIISEYGIPMPEDYGFPLERVAWFLQETWQFFLTATDPEIGNPNDGGRLVQRWCWFSLAYDLYPTGDLVDDTTETWTPLGQVWISYQE